MEKKKAAQRGGRWLSTLRQKLHELARTGGEGECRVVLVGAVHDADDVDAGVRASFTHELEVALPTQDARESLIRRHGFFFANNYKELRREVEEPVERGGEAAEVCGGVQVAGERSEEREAKWSATRTAAHVSSSSYDTHAEAKWLATRTAGSSPADLSALLSRAAAIALARTLKEDSQGDGGGGVRGEGGAGRVLRRRGGGTTCKVSREDVSKALDTLKAQSASAIGAPKVPNVKWDDVGGLEEVGREMCVCVCVCIGQKRNC